MASGRAAPLLLVALMMSSTLSLLVPGTEVEGTGTFDLADNAIRRFDFGNRGSPVKDGYTQVQGGLLYSRGAGYGWDVAHEEFLNLRPPPEMSPYVLQRSWVIGRYGDDMTVDGVRDSGPMTFMVDLPDGEYRVRAVVGDLFYPRYSMNITAEGEQVAGELAAFHMVHRSVYQKDQRGNDANYGMPLPYWFTVTVTDGTLDITFWGDDGLYWQRMDAENATDPPNSYLTEMSTGGVKPSNPNPPYRFIGGPHTYNSVLGLEVYPPLDSLVTSTPSGLVLDPSVTNGSIRDLVDGYNGATTQAEYDDLGRLARMLLVDHGTGDLTDLKALEELMAHLQGDLVADLEPSHLDDRVEGIRALLARDPSDQSLNELLNSTERYRDALGFIFGRVETGKNHFYENAKAISLLWTFQQEEPLHPSASMWRARALFMLDPHRWTSASGTGADIMEALRPSDPANPYIRMYRDTTPTSGVQWEQGQRVVSTTGVVDHWSLADPNSGFEDAPQWASWLREELWWLYDVTDWWVRERQQPDGALGGGWSDDVEFIGLFGFDALISQGADDLSLCGARRFVDGMLASGGVDLERGYSAALADVEHTAEWTGDSLPMMIAVDFGNPRWIEFSMKTGALMRDLWMDETDMGHLHFQSNYLSATRIGGANTRDDAYINYRAALPARWVWWYNRDPEMERLFVDWATAWVEDAMRTDDGKPRGVFPASIGFDGDELGGRASPNWYTASHPGGTVNYDWQPQMYKGYLEELVLLAYEATGNDSLLVPFELEAGLAQAYKDDPVPSPTPGSAEWAGSILGQAAIDRWEAIRVRYDIGGAGSISGEPNGYTTEAVIGMTRAGRRYIDHCLPLMTTEASATDRVAFAGIINPFLIYTGGGIGGALLSPKFTYTGLGRDFAACVQDARPSGASITMYGFYDGVREAGLVPWELQEHGTYEVLVGEDSDGDGTVDEPADYEGVFTWDSKGQVVPIELQGGSEKLVRIGQVENGTRNGALLPDLALARDEARVNESSGALEVIVHNIGANHSGPFNVGVYDPDDGDRLLGAETCYNLDPPSKFNPSTTVVSVRLFTLPSTDNLTIRLKPWPEGNTEITVLNNVMSVTIDTTGLNANGPPVYVGPPTSTIEVEEDANLTVPMAIMNLTFMFKDPDGDALRFEVDYEDYYGAIELVVANGTLWLFHLDADWNDFTIFGITAWDAGWDGSWGNSDDHRVESPGRWVLDILPINDPPVFVGPPGGGTLLEDEDTDLGDGYNLLNVANLFDDVDRDELAYEVDVLDGGEVVTLEAVDGVLVWRWVEENWHGNVTFTMTARDGGVDRTVGNEDDARVTSPVYTLAVRPLSDPPYVASQPEGVGIMYGAPVTVDLGTIFSDPDGDVLYYLYDDTNSQTALNLEVERSSAELTDGVFVLDVRNMDYVGVLEVTFVCYDRHPASSMEQPGIATVVIDVVVHVYVPGNRAPWSPNVTGPPDLEGKAGEDVAFSIDAPFDPDGDAVEVRWDLGDGNVTDWSTSLEVSHAYAAEGEYTVTVTVRDVHGATNSTAVVVDIAPADTGPGDDDDDGPTVSNTANILGAVVILAVVLSLGWFLSRRGGRPG